MEYCLFFKDINKKNVAKAGGKGASLGEMTHAKIPVPPGFVVLSHGFQVFLAKTDVNVEIAAALDAVNHREMHTVEHASEVIQKLILDASMPHDIQKEILAAFRKLKSPLVAVRSSATAEDSASAAWAGQLDTYLNTTKKNLLVRVQECWVSLFTPRAIFYRFEQGLARSHISVAVVVQAMVQSEAAGVVFSVHPVTKDRNQMIIEAGWGLGEAVVSGHITPDSYVVDKRTKELIDVNISGQKKELVRSSKGGNVWKSTGAKGKRQKLSLRTIKALADLVIRIEKHYGFPCDIEWALAKKKLYITQSRPITTL